MYYDVAKIIAKYINALMNLLLIYNIDILQGTGIR